jgi:hypothetical protein
MTCTKSSSPMPELKEYDDIKSIGDALHVCESSRLGLQAANYRCISLTGAVGGTMAGAAAGSAVPIVGNVAGAAIAGRYCWWLHWQALPLILYASDINRQKSEYAKGNIDKIDQWGALRATLAQAAMEGLADKVILNRQIHQARHMFKNMFVRGTVGLGTGAVTEGLTEAGQQLIERYQAGMDISSDEAIEEYLSSAAAGAVLGGGYLVVVGGALSKSSAEDQTRAVRERSNSVFENDFQSPCRQGKQANPTTASSQTQALLAANTNKVSSSSPFS